MSSPALRLGATACATAAVLMLAGSPDFMALERAVSKVFLGATSTLETALSDAAPLFDVPAGPAGTRLSVPSRPFDAPLPPVAPDLPSAVRPAPGTEAHSSGHGLLVPLYASFLALQALDVHSTLRALDRGAAEANPMLAPFTDHPAAFVALKAGTTAGILYMTERVRRHSPFAAIVMMAAFNSVYATVVANNYQIGNQLAR